MKCLKCGGAENCATGHCRHCGWQHCQPKRASRKPHWAVSVDCNGENVVRIESNCLSGRNLSAADEQLIRDCAAHLLAFVGQAQPQAEEP